MFWGGLRGAISLALALSLPVALAEREQLRVMTFGVVLFTLLAQGTTMQFLLRRLGIGQPAQLELEYERRHGRLLAAQAARRRIESLHRDNTISVAAWEKIALALEKQIEENLAAHRELLAAHPELEAEEREDAEMEGLRAQRAALTTMLGNGVISDRVYEELIEEVDAAIARAGNRE
jgi:CPA1 family monovalent cation:H+ antiporter